jgi:hypothetical protein
MDVASPGETLRANIVTPSVIEHAFLAQLEVLRNAVKASRNFRARQKAMCLLRRRISDTNRRRHEGFAESSGARPKNVLKPREVGPGERNKGARKQDRAGSSQGKPQFWQ